MNKLYTEEEVRLIIDGAIAQEREACAKVCDELWRKGGWEHNAGYAADKIRARSNNET
jgi:hypothetical protein